MSHTPGPWVVAGHPWNIKSVEPERLVCSAQFYGALPEPRERAEVEANARLIAAAPELLAACKEVVRLNDAGVDYTGCMESQPDWLKAARAAIAKAEFADS